MNIEEQKSILDKISENVNDMCMTHIIDKIFDKLEPNACVNALDKMFAKTAECSGIISKPVYYASSSIDAMLDLQNNYKPNLIYKWPKCINRRNEKGERVLKLDRMPFGLLEYQIEFFSITNTMQIHESKDFSMWLDTMEADFGGRFMKLFRGPMWSGQPRECWKNPEFARVNIASTSKRQHQNKERNSGFSTVPGLQEKTLDQLQASNPKGRFWFKIDGTDVKDCLLESGKGEWNGDIDLLDGKLQEKRSMYDHRREICTKLMKNNGTFQRRELQEYLTEIIDNLETKDKPFLLDGLQNARVTYQTKFNAPNTSEETLKNLNWEIVEFRTIAEQCQTFKATLEDILADLQPTQNDSLPAVKIQLRQVHDNYKTYLRNLYKKLRQPSATHVLVFMLSDERRNRKPYALPVMYVPYYSLNDAYLRDLSKIIKLGMKSRHLELTGTCTDGEFCTLRTQGEVRMLHIWQCIHDARESVSKMSRTTLLEMLLLVNINPDGTPVVRRPNPAIPNSVIIEIAQLQVQGLTMTDAITHVRGQLVPAGYAPYPFRTNNPESVLDKLRSLVGTYHYRNTIAYWKTQGADFSLYLYVPEVDPVTESPRHDRGDHNHILKRNATSTREGRYDELDVERFDEAMLDPDTGLTHCALIGQRKQSVVDAERLLSFHVARFFEGKGYNLEAEYVNVTANWHEANDGRGISQLQRSKGNYVMMNYILDKWMPWHRNNYDFSTIDINRPVDGIRGFTRETVIEITTNIESQELRRRMNNQYGYEEHPRAGSTDDVEGLFSIAHYYLGNSFTLRDWKYKWKKIVRELCNKMDPELPYYIWTLNERFRDQEDEYPSFYDRPEGCDNLRLHHVTFNQREDSSIFVAGRPFLPARNKPSVRQRMHRPQAVVPPVPAGQNP